MHTKPVIKPFAPILPLLLVVLTACSSGLVSETPTLDLEAQATSSTLAVPVAANIDDAEEVSGSMQLGGKSLDFTAKTTVGLRFGGVEIPAGAKITRAYLEFRAITADSGVTTLLVRGEATDNAAAFRSTAKNLSARDKTAAFSTWKPNAWTKGQTARTSELASILQEIVSRPGWQSGNALAFLVTNGGMSKRSASSREMNGATAPTLYVTFEQPAEEADPGAEPNILSAEGQLKAQVAANIDDAEEVNGSMQLGGKSLDFTTKTAVGLRFRGMQIPAGAKVTAASLEFRAITADSGTATLQLRGEAADNAAAFTTAAGNVSARNKTSAAVTWKPNAWTKGQTARTSELASILQEIVSRPGWQSGNALALIITNSSDFKRSASSHEMSPTTAPILYVSFELPAEEAAPEPEPAPGVGLDTLPDDSLETWNSRLVATITNPQYGIVYDASYGYINNAWMNPVKQASSGDLYTLGRNFNQYATSLILAYRESGDPALMRQLAQLMELARDTLGDPNGDGFLNWRYQHYGSDSSSSPLLGDDYHEMDEMLTHTMVAAVAYALKQAGYGSSAAFWTDYLQNDFEAKWRKRKNKPSGFPFLTKDLMHTYVQWIRYHYYMGKLTGDSSYTREALRMAGVVRGNMRLTSTPGGSSYDWAHRVQLSGSGSLAGCQPMTYVKYTTQAFADLATQDSRLFDSTFLQGVANTMAYKAWKNLDGTQLANDICGGGTHGSLYYGASHPYTVLAAWDNSGILREIAIRTYYATEQNREASPRVYNLPAMMVFTLGQ